MPDAVLQVGAKDIETVYVREMCDMIVDFCKKCRSFYETEGRKHKCPPDSMYSRKETFMKSLVLAIGLEQWRLTIGNVSRET